MNYVARYLSYPHVRGSQHLSLAASRAPDIHHMASADPPIADLAMRAHVVKRSLVVGRTVEFDVKFSRIPLINPWDILKNPTILKF